MLSDDIGVNIREEEGKETAEQMATYYAPIFNRDLRTDAFMKIVLHLIPI